MEVGICPGGLGAGWWLPLPSLLLCFWFSGPWKIPMDAMLGWLVGWAWVGGVGGWAVAGAGCGGWGWLCWGDVENRF